MAQREILFRAWDNTEKRMCNVLAINWDEKLLFWERNVGMENYDSDWWPIDGFTLLQYTGLKDKNGKEIYEGDILSHATNYLGNGSYGANFIHKPENAEVVEYKDGCFIISTGKPVSEYIWNMVHHRVEAEIIGNIYENPELLK